MFLVWGADGRPLERTAGGWTAGLGLPLRRLTVLVEAECRKVCERGHKREWRPWFRSVENRYVLGHCTCGARYRMETRGPKPLFKRGVVIAGDWLSIECPAVPEGDAERLAAVVIRTYLNELEALALADNAQAEDACP